MLISLKKATKAFSGTIRRDCVYSCCINNKLYAAVMLLAVDDHTLIQDLLRHALGELAALDLFQAEDASDAHAALVAAPDT